MFKDIFPCKIKILLFKFRLSVSIKLFLKIDLGVFIVGSSANGFGTNSSDVDICLMVSHEEVLNEFNYRFRIQI